jgi:hypothetical protein
MRAQGRAQKRESDASAAAAAEKLIPNLPFLRLDQLGRLFRVSVEHLYSFVTSGELVVPKELLESAQSRPCIRVPRASIIDFIRRRIARPECKSKTPRKRQSRTHLPRKAGTI